MRDVPANIEIAKNVSKLFLLPINGKYSKLCTLLLSSKTNIHAILID